MFYPIKYTAVEATSPERGTSVQAVYATGIVEASIMMPLSIRNTARLLELNVDEGSTVQKDQVLARMEDNDLQKNIEELKAKAEFAKKDYQRRKSLAAKGYETNATLDQSKSSWDATQAAVERAIAEADLMKIISPADGKVIRRDGEVGQIIPGNQPVFWISCCAPLRISAEVDEEDIADVKIGQEVLIQSDAFDERVFKGKIQSITPKGDPIMRSFRVRIIFTEANPLQIGMTTENNIIINKTENALLIPNTALLKGDKVFSVINGTIKEKALKIGSRGTLKTEVLEGLDISDKLIISNKTKLKDGQKVRTKNK